MTARPDNHQLRNLSLGLRLLATIALLVGWLLFFSAWMGTTALGGWGISFSSILNLGALLDAIHQTHPEVFWLLYLLHTASLLLLIGVTRALVHKMALPRGFRFALITLGGVLAGLDLGLWPLLAFSGIARLMLAPLILLECLVLLVSVLLPLHEMWIFTRWQAKEPVRVVIVGGGFGGLYTALALDRWLGWNQKLDILVLDRKNYFLFPPLLPSVATGAIESRQVTYPFRRVFEASNIRFRKETVERIDPQNRSLSTSIAERPDPITGKIATHTGQHHYDILVLAPGSSINTFNVPGANKHAFFMRELGDAIAVRNHIIDCFEHAAAEANPEQRRLLLRFVVVGAGPTGVELAAEIQDLIHQILLRRYPEIAEDSVEVVLIQSGAQVLPGWHGKVASCTSEQLSRIKVRLVLDVRVVEVGIDGVMLGSGEKIQSRTIVWCTGVKPAPIVANSGLALERSGRIRVEPDLRPPGQDRIFVLGDVAECMDPTTRQPLPALAQVAIQQGTQTALNIVRLIKGKPLQKFRYFNYGALICVGEHHAVVDLMGIRFSGFIAWFVWRTLYLSKLVGFGNKVRVVLDWTLDLLVERSISQIRTSKTELGSSSSP